MHTDTQRSVQQKIASYILVLHFVSIWVVGSLISPSTSAIVSNIQPAIEAPTFIVETNSIHIEHRDITGIKHIIEQKRKRVKRRKERNARPRNSVTRRIAQKPVKYTELFSQLTASTVRKKIITDAKEHLGLRYVWGGTSPRGFDCSGFTSFVLAQNGVEVARSSRYQARQGNQIDLNSSKTGDLVFFSKYGKGGRVTHVAMVVDNNTEGVFVIHATRSGIVVDNLTTNKYWKPKFLYAKDVIQKG